MTPPATAAICAAGTRPTSIDTSATVPQPSVVAEIAVETLRAKSLRSDVSATRACVAANAGWTSPEPLSARARAAARSSSPCVAAT